MTSRQRRPEYYDADITRGDVIFVSILLWIIIAFITALIVFLTLGSHTVESAAQHNAIVERFNSYPDEIRETVRLLDDDNKLSWEDYDAGTMSYWRAQPPAIKRRVWAITLVGLVFVLSAIVFIHYWCKHDRRYYLASFPKTSSGKTVYGLSLLAGGVFLLISYLAMRHAERKTPAIPEEPDTATDASEVLATTDPLPEISPEAAEHYIPQPPVSPETEASYLEFARSYQAGCLGGKHNFYKRRLAELNDEMRNNREEAAETKKTMDELDDTYTRLREDSQHLKLNLEATEKQLGTAQVQPPDRRKSLAEIRAIHQLRGVREVTLLQQSDDDKALPLLRLEIEVHLPYQGKLYDLGAYTLELRWQLAEGMKPYCYLHCRNKRRTAHGTYRHMQYLSSDEEFCFGDRREQIDAFLTTGKIVEALSVADDCLFHVNPHDKAAIPEAFPAIAQIVDSKS